MDEEEEMPGKEKVRKLRECVREQRVSVVPLQVQSVPPPPLCGLAVEVTRYDAF